MFDFGQTRSFNSLFQLDIGQAYLVFEPLLRGPAIKRSPISFPEICFPYLL